MTTDDRNTDVQKQNVCVNEKFIWAENNLEITHESNIYNFLYLYLSLLLCTSQTAFPCNDVLWSCEGSQGWPLWEDNNRSTLNSRARDLVLLVKTKHTKPKEWVDLEGQLNYVKYPVCIHNECSWICNSHNTIYLWLKWLSTAGQNSYCLIDVLHPHSAS